MVADAETDVEKRIAKLDLTRLERSVFTRYHDDGLADIMLGVWFIIAGWGMAGDFAWIVGVAGFSLLTMWVGLRKAITVPRMGEVRFSPERKAKMEMLKSSLGILGLTYGILSIYLVFIIVTDPASKTWIRANVFAAAPLLVPVVFLLCITGAVLQIQRLLGYSLMLTAVLVVGQLTRPPPPLAMLIPGAFILANGWTMLNTFLEDNPLPEMNAVEEA